MTQQEGTAILLMSCPDQNWLVAEISCLYLGMVANIVEAEQHIDVPQRGYSFIAESNRSELPVIMSLRT
jgi:formyltetrahydrofolate hydrolase